MREATMGYLDNRLEGVVQNIFNQELIRVLETIFDPIPVPMILVDKDGIIRMINSVFADYLQKEKAEVVGRHVVNVDKNTRFPYVLKTKKAEIAYKHRFENGQTAIVHRIPVLDGEGEVLYGFGMLLFQNLEEFRTIIEKNKQLHSELFHMKNQLKRICGAKYNWDTIIGSSEKMIQAKFMGKKAAMTTSNVLLLGESGTGKELFAHAVHNDSGRGDYPFIRVNCAAIPSELLEAELFGYEEGAFTGARKGGKIGKFEFANGGTIFLDEIGDLPLDMQAKLLRVLQERELERIGGNETIQLDVRVIAATNVDLQEKVAAGLFREDLYYRLDVMTISIPPLRERMDDLPALTERFIEKLSEQIGKYVTQIAPSALDILMKYSWKGNVRELENILERAINMADGDTILPSHLPFHVTSEQFTDIKGPTKPLKELLETVEKKAIMRAVEEAGGNRVQAAKLLGIGRSSLYEKMEKYQIQ